MQLRCIQRSLVSGWKNDGILSPKDSSIVPNYFFEWMAQRFKVSSDGQQVSMGVSDSLFSVSFLGPSGSANRNVPQVFWYNRQSSCRPCVWNWNKVQSPKHQWIGAPSRFDKKAAFLFFAVVCTTRTASGVWTAAMCAAKDNEMMMSATSREWRSVAGSGSRIKRTRSRWCIQILLFQLFRIQCRSPWT